MIDVIKKITDPIKQRIMNAVGRCVLSVIDDSKKVQELQIKLLAGEVRDKVERFQNYGFTSVPLEGAEGVAVFVSGNREHGLVIAVDDRRYRLKGLEAGEVAIYTDEGDYIKLKRDNKIDISTKELKIDAETKVDITTPTLNIV